MASIYLARATGRSTDWFDYPRRRIIESQSRDAFGSHRIAPCPDDADVVLFATNHNFHPVGLGVLGENIFRRHFGKCVVFNCDDYPSPIIGGLCASWPCRETTPGLAKGWCYHHPNAAEVALQRQPWPGRPKYLWSFCGSAATAPVRGQLINIRDSEGFCENTSQQSLPNLMGIASQAAQEQFVNKYVSLLANSAFVVCPRGRGPSSMRLFEAMRAGRAPVIISDDWTPAPFVAWERCSLRLPEAEIGRLPEFLREHRADAQTLGQRANEEWNRVFGPAGLFHYTVDACLTLVKERRRDFKFQTFKRFGILARPPWHRHLVRWLVRR